MAQITDELIDAYNSGQFYAYVFEQWRTNKEALTAALISLQNERRLDVIGIMTQADRSNSDLFMMKHCVENVLPHVEAPPHLVVRCVSHFFGATNGDMTQGQVISPFRNYCSVASKRAQEALECCLADPASHALIP